jgi:hypothetical protein
MARFSPEDKQTIWDMREAGVPVNESDSLLMSFGHVGHLAKWPLNRPSLGKARHRSPRPNTLNGA